MIRDEALYAGGLLDLRIGGRSVRPPQPKGVAELSYAGSVKWEESTGPGPLPPRPLHPLPAHRAVSAADELRRAGSASLACTRRERTDTPLQALNLLNDPVFFEAAQGLAFRIMREATGGFRDRLNYAYAITLGRQPTAREAERLGKYFDDTSRGLASQTRRPWPRSFPIGWKACRRPKPPPGWS